MNEEKKKNTEIFLKIAAIILAIISAITTEEGFRLIWNWDSAFWSIIISSAFAIAVSLVIVFSSLNIHKYFNEGKGIYLVVVFLFFAFTSLFFNFNSLYGNFVKEDLLKEDAKSISRDLTNIKAKSIKAFDESYKYSQYKKVLDSLKYAADREDKDKFRPGKKGLWRAISLQIPGAESNFQNSNIKFIESKTMIDSLHNSAMKFVDLNNEKIQRVDIEKALENYNKIGEYTQSLTNNFNYTVKKFKNNSGEPDFALTTLFYFVSPSKKLTEKERISTIIALMISFSLDFLVFFALVVLNLPAQKTVSQVKTEMKQDEKKQDVNPQNKEENVKDDFFSWNN